MKNLLKNKVITYGLGGGILEIAYIAFVAWFIQSIDKFFTGTPESANIVLVLLLLVFSVAVSGLLIFGYPIYLVVQKKYKQAINSVMVSLLTLIIGGIIIFNILII